MSSRPNQMMMMTKTLYPTESKFSHEPYQDTTNQWSSGDYSAIRKNVAGSDLFVQHNYADATFGSTTTYTYVGLISSSNIAGKGVPTGSYVHRKNNARQDIEFYITCGGAWNTANPPDFTVYIQSGSTYVYSNDGLAAGNTGISRFTASFSTTNNDTDPNHFQFVTVFVGADQADMGEPGDGQYQNATVFEVWGESPGQYRIGI